MGKRDKEEKDPSDTPGTPEYAAKHSNQAYCTECHSWYDAGNQAQVNAHAH